MAEMPLWAVGLFGPLRLLLCYYCVKRLLSRSDGNNRLNQLERSLDVQFRSLALGLSAQQQKEDEQILEKSDQQLLGTTLQTSFEAHGIAVFVRASPQPQAPPQQYVLQTFWRPDSVPQAAIANARSVLLIFLRTQDVLRSGYLVRHYLTTT